MQRAQIVQWLRRLQLKPKVMGRILASCSRFSVIQYVPTRHCYVLQIRKDDPIRTLYKDGNLVRFLVKGKHKEKRRAPTSKGIVSSKTSNKTTTKQQRACPPKKEKNTSCDTPKDKLLTNTGSFVFYISKYTLQNLQYR